MLELCPELKVEFLIDLLRPLFLFSETELALGKLICQSMCWETEESFDSNGSTETLNEFLNEKMNEIMNEILNFSEFYPPTKNLIPHV